jgi:hypothetical protein
MIDSGQQDRPTRGQFLMIDRMDVGHDHARPDWQS